MGQITFIAHDGEQTAVEIEVGKSLMQLSIFHNFKCST